MRWVEPMTAHLDDSFAVDEMCATANYNRVSLVILHPSFRFQSFLVNFSCFVCLSA